MSPPKFLNNGQQPTPSGDERELNKCQGDRRFEIVQYLFRRIVREGAGHVP